MVSLGVDIGGSSVKALILEDGREIGRWRSDRYCGADASALRDGLAAVAKDAAGVLRTRQVDSLALCVPGVLDPAGQIVVKSVNLPGIEGIRLREVIDEAFGPSVRPSSAMRIVSDARAATHDVCIARGLAGRVLGVVLGTGVGGAVLDDLVPLQVSGQSPGHIGQWDATLDERDDHTPIGPDGGRGGLEAYIGLSSLTARYGALALEARLAKLTRRDPPLRALARAVRIAHAAFRPDHVLLLGGVGIAIGPAIQELRALVGDALTSLARGGWTLASGEDLFHAARGAARLGAEQHLP